MTRTMSGLLVVIMGYVAAGDDQSKGAAVKEPQLRGELLRRVEVDQEARSELVKWMNEHPSLGDGQGNASGLKDTQQAAFQKIAQRVKKVDEENTKWLQEVIQTKGWPTVSGVGKDGAHAAWLLVQHADDDPQFQRKCLDLMKKVPEGEVSGTDLAYLTDRVLLAEGKKQLYGTQFTLVDGQWTPRPLEDETQVDKRRAEVGLPPLSEYIKQLKKMYGSGSKNGNGSKKE